MPAPLSVVIPTLNAAEDLPDTLAGLMEGLHAGLIRDLVVSDGGSEDATAEIVRALGGTLVTGPAGRGGQIGRGVDAAQADWVLILHADTRLRPGWSSAVADHIDAGPDRAGYFRLRYRAAGLAPRIVAAWANLRSQAFGLPYGDQGLLISRDLLDRVGGVPDVPLMEDVVLARALRGRLHRLDGTADTAADRYLREGWVRRGVRNLLLLTRFLLGASPATLARRYRGPSAGGSDSSANCRR